MPSKLNLNSKQFGRLTVLREMPNRDVGGGVMWKCRCRCGKIVLVSAGSLSGGNNKSCGCVRREQFRKMGLARLIDLVGVRFGRLLVLKRIGVQKWLCVCDCGNKTVVWGTNLRRNASRSCGCLGNEARSRTLARNRRNPKFLRNMLAARRTPESRERSRQAALRMLEAGVFGGRSATSKWVTTVKAGRVFCRSSWEIEFNHLCDKSPKVVSVKSEPFRIRYIVDGIERVYLPDRLVVFSDGTEVLVEIKPRNVWIEKHRERNSLGAKYTAARKFCHTMGIRFVILDKEDFEMFLFGRRVSNGRLQQSA